MRINQFLAQAGLGSRRKVEKLVLAGRICLNGEKVTTLSQKVSPYTDKIFLDGEPVVLPDPGQTETRVLALFKPKGYLTSHSDRFHKETVFSLLPPEFHSFRFAGRLDLNSRGLVLFSNSGELIQKISHPSYGGEKEYQVILDRFLDAERVQREFLLGIRDEGEILKAISVEPREGRSDRFTIVLQEGKKRQVRRMFRRFHAEVSDLLRTRIGRLTLKELGIREGEWCELQGEKWEKIIGGQKA